MTVSETVGRRVPAERVAASCHRPVAAFVLPSLAAGGAERVTLMMMRLLDRERWAPILVLLSDDGPLRSCVDPEIPVQVLHRARARWAVRGILRELRAHRPAIVCSSLPQINMLLLALRRWLPGESQLIVREANLPSLERGGSPMSWAVRLGRGWSYRRADRVVASSEQMGAELRRLGIGAERLCILPNPVDDAVIRRRAAERLRHPGLGRRFVCAGRLVKQKGFDRLLTWLATLSGADWHCTILGDGPERKALQSQAERLGIADRIDIAGFEPNPFQWFAGADAVLVPSRWEGLPNVALEALACGAPVIATTTAGGLREVAAQCPPGAVRLAEDADAFIGHLRAVEPNPAARLRPSLLPPRYRLNRVRAEVNSLFDGVLEGRR
jgi:glycosyltransferase involved in cell wall biosynthesis